MGKFVYVRNKPKTKTDGSTTRWADSIRTKVLTTYLATGNLTLAAASYNVPYDTVRDWTKAVWWKEAIDKIHDEDNLELDGKLTKVLEKSIEAINDRLVDGDYQYDSKTGRVLRIPAKLRDVHKVATDMIEKRQVLRKQPTNITEKQEGSTDILFKLAQQFAAFAGKPVQEEKIVNEVHEGVYEHLPDEYKDAVDSTKETREMMEEATNAIHGKREEIVQKRAGMGTQEETQSSEGQGAA